MSGNDIATVMELRKLALEIGKAFLLDWFLDEVVDSVAKIGEYQCKWCKCGSRGKVEVLDRLHLRRIQLSSLSKFVEDLLVFHRELEPELTDPSDPGAHVVMEQIVWLRAPHVR